MLWCLLKYPRVFLVNDIVAKVQYCLYLSPFSCRLARDEARELKAIQLFSLHIASRARGPSEAREEIGARTSPCISITSMRRDLSASELCFRHNSDAAKSDDEDDVHDDNALSKIINTVHVNVCLTVIRYDM